MELSEILKLRVFIEEIKMMQCLRQMRSNKQNFQIIEARSPILKGLVSKKDSELNG